MISKSSWTIKVTVNFRAEAQAPHMYTIYSTTYGYLYQILNSTLLCSLNGSPSCYNVSPLVSIFIHKFDELCYCSAQYQVRKKTQIQESAVHLKKVCP